MNYEKQGTAYDPCASGYELQGRRKIGDEIMPPFTPARPGQSSNPTPMPAQSFSGADALHGTEAALLHAQDTLPRLLSFLANFIPQLRAVLPFLNLLPVAINAVKAVEQATGVPPVTAAQVVADHLTPGEPNSAALSGPQQEGGR